MADAIVQSFAGLSSTERSLALQGLVDQLSSAERQTLLHLVHKKNDIVSRLPIELVQQIFSYLHILDSWSLQHVNKRWHQLLSSDAFLRATLIRWNSHDPSDNGRSAESIACDTTRDKLQHMKNLVLGTPCAMVRFEDTGVFPTSSPSLCHQRFGLAGHRIACIPGGSGGDNRVITRDLINGDTLTLRAESRVAVARVAISSTLAAFVTNDGYFHVSVLADSLPSSSECRAVRLPSSHVRALGVDKSTIALTFVEIEDDENDEQDHRVTLMLYQCRSNSLRQICAKSWSVHTDYWLLSFASPISCSVLVSDDKAFVDWFYLLVNVSRELNNSQLDAVVLHHRILFTGETVKTDSITRHPYRTDHSPRRRWTMLPPASTGHNRQYRIQIIESGDSPGNTKCEVLFDANKGELVQSPSQDLPTQRIIDSLNMRTRRPKRPSDYPHAHWKGTALQVRRGPYDATGPESDTLMNDAFLVSLQDARFGLQKSRLHVFCFDPKIRMYGTTGPEESEEWEEDFDLFGRWPSDDACLSLGDLLQLLALH